MSGGPSEVVTGVTWIQNSQRGFERLRHGWLASPPSHDMLALALLALLWLVLAVMGWGAWVDPHVDDGRELQVPVEIASGKALYRDLAYHYGPAAPYLNAAIVAVAGSRIEVFFVVGLSITLLGAGLVFGMSRLFAAPALAWVAAAFWLTAGMRPWFSDTVVPYSYAAVYGALAVLAALSLACRDLKLDQARSTAWISVLSAFTILTKAEFVLPALLIVIVHAARFDRRQWAIAAVGPAAAAAVYAGLTAWLGYEFLFQDNFNWTPESHFFRQSGGAMLRPAVWNAAPSGIAYGAAWWILVWAGSALAFSRLPERLAWAAAAAAGVLLWYRAPMRPLRYGVLPEALFWAVAGACVMAAILVVRRRQPNPAPVALAAAVALLVSMRSAGDANMANGFVPFTIPMVMASAALVQAAGEFVSQRARSRFRPAPAAILLASALLCLIANRTSGREFVWRGGLDRVSSERGSILVAAPEAAPLQQTLDFLSGARQRGERVWIMPEDMGLAYLSGSGFPYRYYQLLPGSPAPGHWTGRFLDQVNSRPAEWALVCTRPFDEYGVRWFGAEVHQQVIEFVEQRYQPVRDFGRYSPRPEHGRWGARLYRLRRVPPGSPVGGEAESNHLKGIK